MTWSLPSTRRFWTLASVTVVLLFFAKLHQMEAQRLNPNDVEKQLVDSGKLIELEKGWHISFFECEIKFCIDHKNYELESFTAAKTETIIKEFLDEIEKAKITLPPYILVERILSASEISAIEKFSSVYLVAPWIVHNQTNIGRSTYDSHARIFLEKIDVKTLLESASPKIAMSIRIPPNQIHFGPHTWPFALALDADAAAKYANLSSGEYLSTLGSDKIFLFAVAILLAVFSIIDNRRIYKSFIAYLGSYALYIVVLYTLLQQQQANNPLFGGIGMPMLAAFVAISTAILLAWFAAAFAGMVRSALPPIFATLGIVASAVIILALAFKPADFLVVFSQGILSLNALSCFLGVGLLIIGAVKYRRRKRSIEDRIADEEADQFSFLLSSSITALGLSLQGGAALWAMIAKFLGHEQNFNTPLHLISIPIFVIAISLRIGSLKEMIKNFSAKQSKLLRTQSDFNQFLTILQDKTQALGTASVQEQNNIKALLIMTLYLIKRELPAFQHAQFKLQLPKDFLNITDVEQTYLTRIPLQDASLDRYLGSPENQELQIDDYINPIEIYGDLDPLDWMLVFNNAKEHYRGYFKLSNDDLSINKDHLQREHQIALLEDQGMRFGMIHIDNIDLRREREFMSHAEKDFLDSLLSSLNKALHRHIHASHQKRLIPKTKLATAGIFDIAQIPSAETVDRDLAVMSVDIRNFTKMSESLKDVPKGVHLLRKLYSETMADIYNPELGWLESWVGDGAWYAFKEADEAIHSAFKLVDQMVIFNQKLLQHATLGPWAAKAVDQVAIGIAAHYGSVSLGNAGDRNQYNFTILSDMVNTTARIEGLTKGIANSFVISEDLLQQLSPELRQALETVDLGEFTFKGKDQPVRCHRVLRRSDQLAMATAS